jgi:hypothetical protein
VQLPANIWIIGSVSPSQSVPVVPVSSPCRCPPDIDQTPHVGHFGPLMNDARLLPRTFSLEKKKIQLKMEAETPLDGTGAAGKWI